MLSRNTSMWTYIYRKPQKDIKNLENTHTFQYETILIAKDKIMLV